MLQIMMEAVRERLDEPTARGLAGAVSRAIGDGALVPGAQAAAHPPGRRRAAASPRPRSARPGSCSPAPAPSAPTAAAARWWPPPGRPDPGRYRRALRQRARFTPRPLHRCARPGPAARPRPGAAPAAGDRAEQLPRRAGPARARRAVLRERWPVRRPSASPSSTAPWTASTRSRPRCCASATGPSSRVPASRRCSTCSTRSGCERRRRRPRRPRRGAGLPGRRRWPPRPAAVFLQPRAQNPTGASWTRRPRPGAGRRARRRPGRDRGRGRLGRRHRRHPAALARPAGCPSATVHIRSFAKSHGPDLRLAALGGPAAIVDPLTERRLLGQGWTSRLLQLLLLDLLTDPASVGRGRGGPHRVRAPARPRHRPGAAPRRASTVNGADGINLWLPVADEQAALISLASEGIGAAAGAAFTPSRSRRLAAPAPDRRPGRRRPRRGRGQPGPGRPGRRLGRPPLTRSAHPRPSRVSAQLPGSCCLAARTAGPNYREVADGQGRPRPPTTGRRAGDIDIC